LLFADPHGANNKFADVRGILNHLLMSAQQLKNTFIQLLKGIFELSKCKNNNSFYDFPCALFCPLGQNELDIN